MRCSVGPFSGSDRLSEGASIKQKQQNFALRSLYAKAPTCLCRSSATQCCVPVRDFRGPQRCFRVTHGFYTPLGSPDMSAHVSC